MKGKKQQLGVRKCERTSPARSAKKEGRKEVLQVLKQKFLCRLWLDNGGAACSPAACEPHAGAREESKDGVPNYEVKVLWTEHSSHSPGPLRWIVGKVFLVCFSFSLFLSVSNRQTIILISLH